VRPQRNHSLVTPTFDTIAEWLRNHGRVLAGNLELGVKNGDPSMNIRNWRATGTTPGAANTDFTISHGLGFVPDSILTQDTDNGGVLYRSPVTAWTKTTVTLRCTTASANYKVRVV
jgi:hypothetical protein